MAHPSDSCAPDCFGCKVRTVGFSYGPMGRKAFHGDHPDGRTIRERRDRMIAEAGGKQNVEPAGVRWV